MKRNAIPPIECDAAFGNDSNSIYWNEHTVHVICVMLTMCRRIYLIENHNLPIVKEAQTQLHHKQIM